MANTISVETQGISDDWSTANDVFDPISRGSLTEEEFLSALLRLAPLDTPDTDDPCPPHIQTEGKAGDFSFVGQGGSIFCSDNDQDVTPQQASDIAFGKTKIAPPIPTPARQLSSKPKAKHRLTPPVKKKKLG